MVARQQRHQVVLVEYLDTERPRSLDLAARLIARDHQIGTRRYAAGHPRSESAQQRPRLVAGKTGQGTGQHHGAPRERRVRCWRRGRLETYVEALQQLRNHRAVTRFGEKLPHLARHHRPDVVDCLQLLVGGADQRIEGAKTRGQRARGTLPDLAHTEREQQPRQGGITTALDRGHQVGGRTFTHAFQPGQSVTIETVQVGHRLHQPTIDQLLDDAFTEAVDIHRRATGEVAQRLAALRGTRQSRAAAHRHPVAVARRDRPAGRTLARQREHRGTGRPALDQHPHHFRDHVPGPAHHHGIADTYVLATHFVGVVQRGVGHRDPTDMYRRQPRDRRQHPGATDLHLDGEHLGQRLLGRELVRHRPARCARRRTQAPLQVDPIDLVDHPVDVVPEALAALAEATVVIEAAVDSRSPFDLRRHRQTPCGKALDQSRVSRCRDHAGICADAVAVHAERSPGGHRGIELTQAAGRRVARVGELARATCLLFAVELRESPVVDEHLAAHLELRRPTVAIQPRRQ